jgi:pimeloyl-ACP methyl ester carboxylesterase
MVDCAIRKIFRPSPVPDNYRHAVGAGQAIRPGAYRATSRDITAFYGHVVRLSQRYHRITAPTAIVTGDSDVIVAPAIHAYGLARDIPGATLRIVPGCGHMPHWSARDPVIAAIDDVAVRAEEGERDAAHPILAAE